MPDQTCRQACAHPFLGQGGRSLHFIQVAVAVLVLLAGAGVSFFVVSCLSGC